MVTFPDTQTIGLPSFSFDIPTGWIITHPDKVLFCVLHESEGFSPNIVVAHERRSAELSPDQITSDVAEYVDTLNNSKVTGKQHGTNAKGQEWTVIEYVYDHKIGQLASMLAVLTVRHDGVADVIRFHATTAGIGAVDDFKAFHAIISSIVVA